MLQPTDGSSFTSKHLHAHKTRHWLYKIWYLSRSRRSRCAWLFRGRLSGSRRRLWTWFLRTAKSCRFWWRFLLDIEIFISVCVRDRIRVNYTYRMRLWRSGLVGGERRGLRHWFDHTFCLKNMKRRWVHWIMSWKGHIKLISVDR